MYMWVVGFACQPNLHLEAKLLTPDLLLTPVYIYRQSSSLPRLQAEAELLTPWPSGRGLSAHMDMWVRPKLFTLNMLVGAKQLTPWPVDRGLTAHPWSAGLSWTAHPRMQV